MSDQSNTETTPTPEQYPLYELIVSFVPRQQALIRIAAPDEDTARTAVLEMATETTQDFRVESIIQVEEDAPIPDDYEAEGTNVKVSTPDKRYH